MGNGDGSKFDVLTANLPLGLQIEQPEEDATVFIVGAIAPGGAVSLGEVDIKVGDMIRAITTENDGQRGVVETSILKNADELNEAIYRNEDGQVTLVVERPGELSLGGMSWMI